MQFTPTTSKGACIDGIRAEARVKNSLRRSKRGGEVGVFFADDTQYVSIQYFLTLY